MSRPAAKEAALTPTHRTASNRRSVPGTRASRANSTTHARISATTTSTPFVKKSWLGTGITVYSIGKNQEMESDVYKKSDKFVVDSWLHCKNKSDMQRLLKENFLSEKDLYAELPELLSGKKPGRESDKERIFIRAIGLVNQDIAMANTIYQSAMEKGIGTRLPY